MTIYRNGEAIELTDREMFDAYYEQRDKFDLEDIKDYFDSGWGNAYEDDWEEKTGLTIDEWLAKYGAEAALRYRRNLDNYDDYWLTARHEAIECVKELHRPEEDGAVEPPDDQLEMGFDPYLGCYTEDC